MKTIPTLYRNTAIERSSTPKRRRSWMASSPSITPTGWKNPCLLMKAVSPVARIMSLRNSMNPSSMPPVLPTSGEPEES